MGVDGGKVAVSSFGSSRATAEQTNLLWVAGPKPNAASFLRIKTLAESLPSKKQDTMALVSQYLVNRMAR